jgi:hypothetical protein
MEGLNPEPYPTWADEATEPLEDWSLNDPAISPPYYQAEGFDLLDVIEAFGLGYSVGCAIKYLVRAGRKPGEPRVKDLQKAKCYLERAIEREFIFGACDVAPPVV